MIETLNANSFEDLFSIHQSEFNIGLMSIKEIESEKIKEYLEENFEKLPLMYKCIISKENFATSLEQLNDLYYILNDCDEKSELINLIKTLTSNFADITDSPEMGVSLEKIQTDLCKNFHCDMNYLRLVYPLLGPGTLWLKEDNIRREFLGRGLNEKVVIDPTQIFQVPSKTIILLKGQGHPSAQGKAVVHASPMISGMKEKRVLLRIESIF